MTQPPEDERPLPWQQPSEDPPDDAADRQEVAVEHPAASGPLLSSSPSPGIPPTVAWAAPSGPAPEVAPGLTYAGIAPRVVGYVVDLIIVGIVAGIIGSATGLVQAVRVGDTTTMVGSIGYDLLSVVLGAAYFIGSWSGGRRATLGQRLFSIQVGNAVDGRALTTEQAVRRWAGLGLWIGALGFTPILAGFTTLATIGWVVVLLISTATSPTKQGIHDRIAGSATARPTGAGNGLVTTCLVIVIGFLLLSLLAIVALIFLGGQISAILSDAGQSI